jgi:hypothetical protein
LFTQVEAYVSDSWKAHPKLSLELGLRFQYQVPIYTQANNIVNFDPRLYDPSMAVTVLANGLIDASKGGNRFNGLIRAGDGVPARELGRVPNGDSPQVLAVPAGAPRGLYDTARVFAPRLGFAWSQCSVGAQADFLMNGACALGVVYFRFRLSIDRAIYA